MSTANKEDYGSDFLYAHNLARNGKWCGGEVTIKAVIPPMTLKAANKTMIEHETLEFVEVPKQWVISSVWVMRVLIAMFGEDRKAWVGRKIYIYPALLDKSFEHKNVPTIRIRPPQGFHLPVGARKQWGTPLEGPVCPTART